MSESPCVSLLESVVWIDCFSVSPCSLDMILVFLPFAAEVVCLFCSCVVVVLFGEV
jgi:hypothetical protein